MSWKSYDFKTRQRLGEFPDEMSMSQAMRDSFPIGTRIVVENDDGDQYEAHVDADVVKITVSPSLAEIDAVELSHEEENYSPYASGPSV